MIVVDSSAIIAIFRQEHDAEDFARRIATDDDPVISAANLVETSIVLRGLKEIAPARAERWLADFIEAAGIRIELPVSVPLPSSARFAVTAVTVPPEDPPGEKRTSKALPVRPNELLRLVSALAKSGMLV